jgi:hypothetical protein
MKVGDLMRCTFGGQEGFVTLLSTHHFDAKFWSILWNGEVMLMHEDHLVTV